MNVIMQRMHRRPLRIVLPGGSGQVGTIVARHFHSLGSPGTELEFAL